LEQIKETVCHFIAKYANIKIDNIELEKTSIDNGLSSTNCKELADSLSLEFNIEVPVSIFNKELSIASSIKSIYFLLNKNFYNKSENEEVLKNPRNLNHNFFSNNKHLIDEKGLFGYFNIQNQLLVKLLETENTYNQHKILMDLFTKQYNLIMNITSSNGLTNLANQKQNISEVNNESAFELKIMDIISQLLDIPKDMFNINDRLVEDLGFNSLKLMELSTRLIEVLKTDSGLIEELSHCESIQDIILSTRKYLIRGYES